MYNTISDVHIAVYQRLQQMSSNRHQSIAPQFIDMCLNSAMTSVIRKKFDARSNYKREGFEDSVQRYDDLQSLKRLVDFVQFDQADLGRGIYSIPLPVDYMNLISCNVSVTDPNARMLKSVVEPVVKTTPYTISLSKTTLTLEIGGITYEESLGTVPSTITNDNQFIYLKAVNAALKTIQDKANGDIAFTRVEIDAKTPSIEVDLITNLGNSTKARSVATKAANDLGRFPVRLVSSTDKDKLLDNHYYVVNAHKAPLATVRGNKLIIQSSYRNAKRYPLLSFSTPSIEYLAYPVEFNIDTKTMPKLSFTDDVINAAVSELLLIVKDPTVNISKQTESQI